MENPIDSGLAFQVDDIFRGSSLMNEEQRPGSIFGRLDTDLSPLQTQSEKAEFTLFDLDLSTLPQSVDKAVPDVDRTADVSHDGAGEQANVKDEDLSFDIFNDIIEERSTELLPSPCTWEAFGTNEVSSETPPLYLSEAGPGAFDALYSARSKTGQHVGVLPRDLMLRALSSLALGRSSTFFRWNEIKQRFEARLEKNPISGISLVCSSHAISELAETGTTLTRMWNFAAPRLTNRKTCPAMVAMQSCTASVLDAIEESISAGLSNIRSILQLQAIVVRPRRLLSLLSELTRSMVACKTDESVISIMSDFVHAHAATSGEFCTVLRAMLERTSAPWLERLAVELNFRSASFAFNCGQTQPGTQGISMSENIPFLQKEDQELILTTKLALDVIREHTPEHGLLTYMPEDGGSLADLLVDAHFDPTYITKRASDLHKHVTSLIGSSEVRHARHNSITAEANDLRTKPVADIWTDHSLQEDYISGLEAQMSYSVARIDKGTSHELQKHVRLLLENRETDDTVHDADLGLAHGFLFDRIRPLVQVQSRLANGIVIRQILRDHSLMHHLALHKAYYFFGSGEFTSQLASALFNPELQSAERRRGKYATSEPMGLRLASSDAAQNWPPASSELSMVLVGVLSKVLHSEEDQAFPATRHRDMLQTGLNFAIRELSEDEIEQVMDAHSIHALDLLGLQYNTPAPLDMIITPENSKEYDGIFRLLVLLMRLIYSTSNLFPILSSLQDHVQEQETPSTAENYMFLHRSHHVVTVILSHFMDVGIATPWQKLCGTLQTLSEDLRHEDAHGVLGHSVKVDLVELKSMHNSCLTRIRSRLFLRKKQHKIREAFEQVFSSILRGTALLQGATVKASQGFMEEYREFHTGFARLISTLEEYTERAYRSAKGDDAEDIEAVRILLSRLKWREQS